MEFHLKSKKLSKENENLVLNIVFAIKPYTILFNDDPRTNGAKDFVCMCTHIAQ